MTEFEQLQARLLLLEQRVKKLEVQQVAAGGSDSLEAQRLAEQLGFAVDLVRLPGRREQRRTLARALAAAGWTQERVGRALGCSDRTVRSWLARFPEGGGARC